MVLLLMSNIQCLYCNEELDKNIGVNFGLVPMTPNALEKGVLLKGGIFFEYELIITVCAHCGLIQQYYPPDPNILYFRFKNESVGAKWQRHYQQFTDFIMESYWNDSLVLEVGAGDLNLANMLIEKGIGGITTIDKNIISTNLCPKINHIDGFLEEIEFKKKFDVVYSSHVFEHVSNIKNHLSKITAILNNGGHFIFSLPDFQKWIENFHLNAFSQEHNIYPLPENIEKMLTDFGFNIKRIFEFESHSLFIDAEYDSNIVPTNLGLTYEKNLKMVKEFKRRFDSLIRFLANNVKQSKIFMFGANSSTQIILKNWLGARAKNITILDNAKIKENKYLYGFNYLVKNPIVLKDRTDVEETIILIFTGAYVQEIKEQVLGINDKLYIITTDDFVKSKPS